MLCRQSPVRSPACHAQQCNLALCLPCAASYPPHSASFRLKTPPQITEGASNADCEGVFAWLDERTPTFKVGGGCPRGRCSVLRLQSCAPCMLCCTTLLIGALKTIWPCPAVAHV